MIMVLSYAKKETCTLIFFIEPNEIKSYKEGEKVVALLRIGRKIKIHQTGK